MSENLFIQVIVIASGVVLILLSGNIAAQSQVWTLESTAKRLVQEAPERNAAEANVLAYRGNLNQSDVWPNPTIELGASNAMGKDDNIGGIDFNRISIAQPLPLSGRLGLQRKQATAHLKQAEAEVHQQNLKLEYAAARVFHRLQFNRAQLKLAEQRLESADEFRRIGRHREQAGDLSRLERLRLDLVRESALQVIASATGTFNEALAEFQTVLNIDETKPNLDGLEFFPDSVPLAGLTAQQDIHPALMAARQNLNAAGYNIAIARADRFSDPQVWLAQERDVLGNRRQNATAFGMALTLPLWDRNKGKIAAARANKLKAKHGVEVMQRKLTNRLRLSYFHLMHLIEQGKKYRVNVLEPAEEVFRLTRKGFATGQVGILNLVDAVDTHFNARIRHLELLRNAWLQAAALRQASGKSLFSDALVSLGTKKGIAQ